MKRPEQITMIPIGRVREDPKNPRAVPIKVRGVSIVVEDFNRRSRTVTKQEIKSECLRMGYTANYLGKDKLWDIRRIKPSGNSRAFDSIVFLNMVRRLGIEHSIKP